MTGKYCIFVILQLSLDEYSDESVRLGFQEGAFAEGQDDDKDIFHQKLFFLNTCVSCHDGSGRVF